MFQSSDIIAILPEIFVLCAGCLILVVDLFISEKRRSLVYLLSILTLVFAGLLTMGPHGSPADGAYTAWAGTFVRDSMGDVLKIFIYLSTALVFVYCKDYLRERGLFKGEFFVLVLFAVLGMMVLVSAWSLVTLYLGLELMALCSYALVCMDRDSERAPEAAMKYFVLGAIASGMLLYGMSMIYGATGSLSLPVIAEELARLDRNDLVLAFGIAFMVVGIAFKLGAVPFHMWLPDVYEGTPTAIVTFIGSAPKIAAFGMAMRLLVDGAGPLLADWSVMLAFLAVASLAVGNVVAIAQTNIKRMLAYSTISHIGFLLLGILSGTTEGYAASMFYVISYALMTTAAFGIITALSKKGFEADKLEHYKGLGRTNGWYALLMLLVMASLAGLPPFLGFFAKFLVIMAAIDAGLVWLGAVAVLFAVIGAFYYLRIIKLMYFDEPEQTLELAAPAEMRAVLTANSFALLLVGIFSGPLAALCLAAMQ